MKRPVFVVGCPRSGTTLLYSMLIAAGGFAFYRKETHLFVVAQRYPNIASDEARRSFLSAFLSGYLGRVPGLDIEPIARAAVAGCDHVSEFLPRLMDGVAREQRMERWVEATPAHVLYLSAIKRAVPDALIVHVIRDGRDCALSLDRQGWLPSCPWDRNVAVAAVYWEWMVRAGQAAGRTMPQDYLEVRFEDLIDTPASTLRQIAAFIDHDLDYDRIQKNPVHAMYVPNTSFRTSNPDAHFDPVGRWRTFGAEVDVESCERAVGQLLEELGYTLAAGRGLRPSAHVSTMTRAAYLSYFRVRHAMKSRTPLGRLMTRDNVWAEQPRAGERPVREIPGASEFKPTPEGDVVLR